MSKQKTPTAGTTTNKYSRLKLPTLSLGMNKFRRALFYTGLPHKKGVLQRINELSPELFKIIEVGTIAVIIIAAMIVDLKILLIIPLLGALLYFKDHFKWMLWILKVYVLQRKFYSSRRRLYNQGSLLQYMNTWKPKSFNARKAAGGQVIIWGASPKIIEQRFKKMQENGTLEQREYISNV